MFASTQQIQVLLFGTFWNLFLNNFALKLVESLNVKTLDKEG